MLFHVLGDATRPLPVGTSRAILHVCNNLGRWGRGFVNALNRRFGDRPERIYREELREEAKTSYSKNPEVHRRRLGEIQVVEILSVPDEVPGLMLHGDDVPYHQHAKLWVVNMIAQDGLRTKKGDVCFDEEAFRVCLRRINGWIFQENGANPLFDSITLHMPRVGCGLGGARWEDVEAALRDHLAVDAYVYTLPSEKKKYPPAEYIEQDSRLKWLQRD
jgi:O-acetyl-ADP-ribose deacetylase (regulator of RNase III)